MTAAPRLTCMAWDHPRALDPLKAISTDWSARTGIEVTWVARPLKDFEDQPLEELAGKYDLVLMDYPFTGTAATSGLIAPVDDWVDADYLDDQRHHSVGPSFASYTWGGRQWALAIDAAAQVSAVRADLWPAPGWDMLPQDWEAVASLAAGQSRGDARVALPLNPNHAYCAFIAVGISLAGAAFWPFGCCFDTTSGAESLRFLKALAPCLHPVSRNTDPITVSDRMAATDEVLFVPLMFGYSSYARTGFHRHRLCFGNAPAGPSGMRGSVLGGAGIALSALSAHGDAAADLARTIGSGPVQANLFVDSGGQPGHGIAWDSDRANAQTGGFFRATRDSMNQAFVRPRVPGHRPFQPQAGSRVHRFLWGEEADPLRCIGDLRRLYDRHLEGWGEIETAAGSRPPGLNARERT